MLTTRIRVVSGVIMSLIGLLYMAFEPFVLSDFSLAGVESNKYKNSQLSRVATGIQVMIIRSHVLLTKGKCADTATTGWPHHSCYTGDSLERPVNSSQARVALGQPGHGLDCSEYVFV